MASAEQTPFESNAQKFADYGEEIRGFIRYEVLHHYLDDQMSRPPIRIADIGGGSAIDAIWAANYGHEVTIVEPADAQLALAQERIAQADEAVQRRIHVQKGTIEDVLSQNTGSFDMVFSHRVAMYLPNPEKFINQLVRLTKPGGYISLLEKGYNGTEARLITEHKFDELAAFHATKRVINNQGREVHAFTALDLRKFLDTAGAVVLDWAGVRVITEGMHDSVAETDTQVLQAIVDAEIRQGRLRGIRSQGQMLHVLAIHR